MTHIDPQNLLMTITVADLDAPENNSTIVGRVVRVIMESEDLNLYYLEDPAGSDDSVLKVTIDAREGYEAQARE